MKNLKIALVLFVICLICAAGISGMYMLTNPIIEANNNKKELETVQSIFDSYDQSKSETITEGFSSSYISKKIIARDQNNNDLGTIYTVAGKNDYGNISLMVAIKGESIYRIEFLENGQSFGANVNSFLKTNFPSSKENVIEGGFVTESETFEGELNFSNIDSIDVSCGATYGAKLIMELVNAAVEDSKGVN